MNPLDSQTGTMESTPGLGGVRTVAWTVGRIGVGVLLLAAAGLKAYELATSPIAGDGWLASRPVQIAVVEYELVLGLWLLSGWRPRSARATTIATFGVFAAAATTRVVAGDESCGCFGKLAIDPRWTLTLDLLVMGWLAVARPSHATGRRLAVGRNPARGAWAAGLLAVVIGIPAGWWMGRYEPAIVGADGTVIGEDQFVVLEPETWVNQVLPIIPHIDIGAVLGEGDWLVLLYRHDCPHCVESLANLHDAVPRIAADGGYRGVAVIELPPYAPPGADPVPVEGAFHRGRLSAVRDWFVQTPAAMELSDGVVVAMRPDLAE